MIDRKNGEPKTPQIPGVESSSETEQGVRESREAIEDLSLSAFAESALGQELLASFGFESVSQVLEDEDLFLLVVTQMDALQGEEVESELFHSFLEIAAKRQPDWVRECFELEHFSIADPEARKRIWELVKKDEDETAPDPFGEPDSVEDYVHEKPEVDEKTISPSRRLLTEPGHKNELPPAVAAIIGDHESFWAAMDDMDSDSGDEPFEMFITQLKALQASVEPEIFNEMLTIAAEQDDTVDIFLKDYGVISWQQAMENNEAFSFFVSKSWLLQASRTIKPIELFHQLLRVAARASRQNAQWFLEKARQDDAGETKFEGEPQERARSNYLLLEGEPQEGSQFNYLLKNVLGEEGYKIAMESAQEMLKED